MGFSYKNYNKYAHTCGYIHMWHRVLLNDYLYIVVRFQNLLSSQHYVFTLKVKSYPHFVSKPTHTNTHTYICTYKRAYEYHRYSLFLAISGMTLGKRLAHTQSHALCVRSYRFPSNKYNIYGHILVYYLFAFRRT